MVKSPNDILLGLVPEQAKPVEEPKTEVQQPVAQEEPKVEEPVVETPQVPEPVTNLDEWDDSQPQEPKQEQIDPFFKEVGIEANSWDEAKVKLKDRLTPKQYPEDLKKALEVWEKGGDYLEVLKINSVDYSKIDPVQIYESYIQSNSNSPEEATTFLDSKTEIEKRIEGRKLQQQYIAHQKQQEMELVQRAEAAKQAKIEAKKKADEKLQATLEKVDKIAGLTLKPHHKSDIYDAFSTGRAQKELFYDPKTGDYDYGSMIETYFLKKNLPKIMDHLKKVTETSTKREVIQGLTNAQITKPTEKAEPTQEKKSVYDYALEQVKPKVRKG